MLNISHVSILAAFLASALSSTLPVAVGGGLISSDLDSVAYYDGEEEQMSHAEKNRITMMKNKKLVSHHGHSWKEIKRRQSLKNKSPKGGGFENLEEECIASDLSALLTSYTTTAFYIHVDTNWLDGSDMFDNCDLLGTDRVYCDFSYSRYGFGGDGYEDCLSNPDNQWVILTSTVSDLNDVTLIMDTGVCNPKSCDVKEVLQYFSVYVTTDLKKVENGPKKKKGKLDDCLEEDNIDMISDMATLNLDFYFSSLYSDLSTIYDSCELRKMNTLYCEDAYGDALELEEQKDICVQDADDQWVVLKVKAQDVNDNVTVILDDVAGCLPKNCDAKALVQKLNNPVTHKVKKIEDGGRLLRG